MDQTLHAPSRDPVVNMDPSLHQLEKRNKFYFPKSSCIWINLSCVCLSVFLSVCRSIYMSFCKSACLSVSQSICQSIDLCVSNFHIISLLVSLIFSLSLFTIFTVLCACLYSFLPFSGTSVTALDFGPPLGLDCSSWILAAGSAWLL